MQMLDSRLPRKSWGRPFLSKGKRTGMTIFLLLSTGVVNLKASPKGEGYPTPTRHMNDIMMFCQHRFFAGK
ncbi:MAG: hypothetical protein A3G33_05135 [Omnitrophica bacterium RIFCSPLOWO2_12_FULL_44_17]|uniref:Uncharacterized protein n=1 Tax=Candidatus Danuiimicrobium aquiferis TaxID=1801832 RepID=A0A1G1KX82_9BACT|nr:MAG: hypothetical protein A3B72_01505 [Omnitrophica bacterium RIFCSPHIGHO2_02_FULL_45_28]OGW97540.1 MAG: hypothetical protein A3G33_05135 [Omnitrophica bacterium RIFCSPLOWO2_12_FULL_44_17]